MLNESENTEFVWLSPDEALSRYEQKQMAMFPPQIAILCQLIFYRTDYRGLKELLLKSQKNEFSYLTERSIWFSFT